MTEQRKLTSCTNFLTCRSNSYNDALSPTLVTGFQRRSHYANVPSTVKSIVTSSVSHLNKVS